MAMQRLSQRDGATFPALGQIVCSETLAASPVLLQTVASIDLREAPEPSLIL